MDLVALEQIQLKVEAGEPLLGSEVRALQSAALAEPGPKWRLVIAHALINVERPDAALPLMEALVREAPNHPQTKLGLARALIALDRYPEAERMLKEALAHRPSDVEALKALAVLALRRGERELAKKLVADARKHDPFDPEARTISAEIEAPGDVTAPAVAIASERAFLNALLEELKTSGVPHLQRGAHLFLKTGGHVGRVDVRGLYDSYVSETRPLPEVISDIARQFSGTNAELLGREELLRRVRPVLRDQTFVEKAAGAASQDLTATLRIFYVIDDPELVRYVPVGLVKRAGLMHDELHTRAFKNLEDGALELKRARIVGAEVLPGDGSSPFIALWHSDGYDGARVLLSSVLEKLRAELGSRVLAVNLGRRDGVVLCAADDAKAVAALRDLPVTDGLSGLFEIDSAGKLT